MNEEIERFVISVLKELSTKTSPEMVAAIAEFVKVIKANSNCERQIQIENQLGTLFDLINHKIINKQ
ncbi:hypothetical protein [Liquorilactobacillus mali]|uniref:hypothetical protein n=1 Tax=Liquorilactobacillus mali TaxID=1618 RepID=UPI002955BCC6|nr:hypothetical protein [Liquorilactobacillus mali]MDV7756857.1 hypothetical protein [Liquorilactobacillus mali]